MSSKIKIGIVDDHVLLRTALASLINNFETCQVVCQANNGQELIEKMTHNQVIDVILLDLSMPVMDGFDTAVWLNKNHPNIHTLMLTMYDSEITLIRLLQVGIKGFLKKDIDPLELKFAINSVVREGYYYSTHTAGRLANLFRNGFTESKKLQDFILNDQEIEFLKLACSDLTYKEIAQKMRLTPRTIDFFRDQLFLKFDVKSRVGLAMVALKNGIVNQTN
jgi:two-component system, NarL family, invasion response regulator UvrY